MNSDYRVLLVDDHKSWRRHILSILEPQPGLQVIGEASDGIEAVQKAQQLKPDLILLDIGLPKLNGIETEHRIHNIVPSAKVLFLSQNFDADIVRAALSNGALGYVLKTDAARELLPAIKAVLCGRKFTSSGIKWRAAEEETESLHHELIAH